MRMKQMSVYGRMSALRRGLALVCAALVGAAVFAASADEPAATYCVIDLSAGADATSYPVSYLDAVPEGGWTDEYKTTKIVLRRIKRGSFVMGTRQSDESCRVTLTKPFYMGVFEVTQRQWELVMDENPSEFSGTAAKPVECVSYFDIRGFEEGAQWPASSAVDEGSFLGALRTKTGIDFDLPTEAQWEYACRAGTTTKYYWGTSMKPSFAWYEGNAGDTTHEVGKKTPNGWGLYDMNGNVWEWCLDWDDDGETFKYSGTDPRGLASGVWRSFRGGAHGTVGAECNSTYRDMNGPMTRVDDVGFRLACPAEDTGDEPECGLEVSYGPFVPGEPVSLDIPDLVGYKAKGLPSGLKFDAKNGRITGAAKKPTGEAGVSATFAKKGAATLTARFVVGPLPAVSVALAGDAAGCRVTGADKAYLAGKKVTLAAKAPKGTAFTGWTRDGAPWPDADSARQAKLSFAMPAEDVALVASFERERMSVACPALAAAPLAVGVAGADGGFPLEVETQSGVKSVKAKGLPSGMKLAKDRETGAWRIVGVPKRAGSYKVTLTVTAASGAQETLAVEVAVAPLPAWAVGTFAGTGYYFDRPCSGTLAVSANGKVSGKVVFVADDGRLQTSSFSAPALTG